MKLKDCSIILSQSMAQVAKRLGKGQLGINHPGTSTYMLYKGNVS